MTTKTRFCLGLLLSVYMLSEPVGAQRFANASITTVPVADGIYMLMGPGGNIGVSVGADGVLLIDDQFAPMNDKIVTAIAAITEQPVTMVFNTHWHRDHTGGNEPFAEAGALIIAHDNVRKRMSSSAVSSFSGSETPPSPAAALPTLTFYRAITLHFNGMTIHAERVGPAHTDGDSVVSFREANVLHLGDTFFNGFYPFIDINSGGSMRGMTEGIDRMLPYITDETKIMPGHGPLADRKALVRYRDMMTAVSDRIGALIAKGQSRQQVVDAKPTAEFDAEWGNGFLKPDQWVALVYDVMVAEESGDGK